MISGGLRGVKEWDPTSPGGLSRRPFPESNRFARHVRMSKLSSGYLVVGKASVKGWLMMSTRTETGDIARTSARNHLALPFHPKTVLSL